MVAKEGVMLAAPEVEEHTETAPVVPAAVLPDAAPVPEVRLVPEPPAVVSAGPFSPRFGLGTMLCFCVSLGLCVLAAALAGVKELNAAAPLIGAVGGVAFVVSTVVAASRAVAGIVKLVRSLWTGEADGRTAAAVLGNLAMTWFGMLVAYLTTVGFSRGRQLRRFGKVLLPEVRPSDEWTAVQAHLADTERPPAGLADQWRENGRTEHASVAAFARLTLDLMALGAPPRLVAAANQDALDEIRHTELCLSLARALDGRAVSPGPFPQAQRAATLPRARTLALAKLAVGSLIDGALHEGVSARIVARLARRCEVPAIRAALREIAADEGRHSAHGWTAVEWCLAEGGRPVAEALLGAIRVLPETMHSQLPAGAAEGGWERWGIHGARLESEEYRAARVHVVARVQALVAPARAAAWARYAVAGGPNQVVSASASPG
jgi:hypothetical protein